MSQLLAGYSLLKKIKIKIKCVINSYSLKAVIPCERRNSRLAYKHSTHVLILCFPSQSYVSHTKISTASISTFSLGLSLHAPVVRIVSRKPHYTFPSFGTKMFNFCSKFKVYVTESLLPATTGYFCTAFE